MKRGSVLLVLLISLAVAVALAFYYFGSRGVVPGPRVQEPTSQQQEPVPESSTPEGVTEAFYSWYINCVNQSFEGKTKREDCSYEKSTYVSEGLVEELNKIRATFTGGGYDLVTCAQDIPTKFVVEKESEDGDKAIVFVFEFFGTIPMDRIRVHLEKAAGEWKIYDIVCPIPGGPSYQNEDYGFEVTLPGEWEGYKVTEHGNGVERSICFSFEDRYPICVLNIYVHTPDEWESISKKPNYIDRNDDFVFSFDYSPDCVQHDEFQCARAREVPAIIETFKFKD